jgi:hypothetical protein
MQATSSSFKTLINFNLIEFEVLAQLAIPTIIGHVTSIGELHHISRQLFKLTLE